MKAARELGFKGQIGEGAAGKSAQLVIQGAGKENAIGYIAWSYLDVDYPTPNIQPFADHWQRKYNQPFNFAGVDYSTVAWSFAQGVEAAQSLDPEVIAKALEKGEFTNLWGKFRYGLGKFYGIGHQYTGPLIYFRIEKDGLAHPVLFAQPSEYLKYFD